MQPATSPMPAARNETSNIRNCAGGVITNSPVGVTASRSPDIASLWSSLSLKSVMTFFRPLPSSMLILFSCSCSFKSYRRPDPNSLLPVSQPAARQSGRDLPDLKPYGQFPDAWVNIERQPFQRQYELTLTPMKSRGANCLLAEGHEETNLMAQFSKYLIIIRGEDLFHAV